MHAVPAATLAVAAKRILVLSVSAGSGHVRAAEAIRHAAEHEGAQAIHIDVMDYVPRAYRTLYTDFYIALVNRFPALWGWLYRITDRTQRNPKLAGLRRLLERKCARRLLDAIEELAPDAIVCTHFLPAEILSHSRTSQCPVWVQVTDFDLHRAWIHSGVTGYFAGSAEVAFRMRAAGIAPDAIHLAGIPIMPAFATRHCRRECANELGLDPERQTVLMMGGGAGIGGLDEIAERLLAAVPDFQLLVLAGQNKHALQALRHLAYRYPDRLVALPFTNQVERAMACSDLAITKPGGLSTSECLAQGLPMILYATIPGQEERNADYLFEHGVALKASDAVTLEFRLRELLTDCSRLEEMAALASKIARPAAGRIVARTVIAMNGV